MSQAIAAGRTVFDHPTPNVFAHVDGSVVMSATDRTEAAPEKTLVSTLGLLHSKDEMTLTELQCLVLTDYFIITICRRPVLRFLRQFMRCQGDG